MKLVIHPPVDEDRLRCIQAEADGFPVVNCETYDAALSEIVTASAFFGKMTPELLENALGLEWVQAPTASLEHYLFPELIAHPCQLTNMRGLFDDVIADHVFAYITCIARNLHIYLRQQQQQRWEPIGGSDAVTSLATGPGQVSDIDRQHLHLADCTIGVIGVGRIGAEVCRRAKAFGMNVLGVDPVMRQVEGIVEQVWDLDRLPDLLSMSDFVVSTVPHTPNSVGMLSTPQFLKMKSTAWLINIGRGVVVDLEALTTALHSKQIAGAALDVFETEPLPENHPLWPMPNVIITPHVAAASPRIAERHLETLIKNLNCFLNEEPFVTLVDKVAYC